MRTNLGLRQLQVIVTIADCGSFSAAAHVLHVSQPALSRTVRMVEEALGTRVFDRDTRSLNLTPAGLELMPIARRVIHEFLDSMSDLSQFMEGRRGRVRISSLPSMAQGLVVDNVARFARDHPKVQFVLRVDTADQVLELLEGRHIDIGLTVQPPPDGRFAYQHLYDDDFVLLCRDDDPLAGGSSPQAPLPWSVLADRAFIAASPGSNTRSGTDRAFMDAGLTIRPAHEVGSSNLPVIGSLVAAGLGISVLPASTLPCLSQPGLVSRALLPKVQRRLGIVTLAGSTASVPTTLFCAQLLAACGVEPRGEAARD